MPRLAFAIALISSLAVTAPAAQSARTYWAYVGAESADRIHRLRFDGKSLVVERTTLIGEIPNEMEGPHGLQTSRDGRLLFMTTGHGRPEGKLWIFDVSGSADTLVGPTGIDLGNFPASVDVTPDGLYTFSVNFNLHGDMVPSTVSVVYVPDRTEVARRFSVAKGKEGAVPAAAADEHAGHRPAAPAKPPVDPAEVGYTGERHKMAPASCSPTWAQPSAKGDKVYVACNKADEILEIDTAAWTLSRRIPTGRGVYNLAVTPDGRRLVATLKQGSMVEIFDLPSGKSLARLKTSTSLAHGVSVTPDSRYAFVSSEGVGSAPGFVDVFDVQKPRLAATASVGQQASGITFWKMK